MSVVRTPVSGVFRSATKSVFHFGGDGSNGGGSLPPAYTPALKFNDARNSQYLLLFPWLGITPTGAAVPATAITLGGDPLTLGGEYLTVG